MMIFQSRYRYKVYEQAPFATRKSQRLGSATSKLALLAFAVLLLIAEIMVLYGIMPFAAILLLYPVLLLAFFFGLRKYTLYKEAEIEKEAQEEAQLCRNLTEAQMKERFGNAFRQHEELRVFGWFLIVESILSAIILIKTGIRTGNDVPKASPAGGVSWLLPVLGIGIGIALIAAGLKRSKRLYRQGIDLP